MQESKAFLKLVSNNKFPLPSSKTAELNVVSTHYYVQDQSDIDSNAYFYGNEKAMFLHKLVYKFNSGGEKETFVWTDKEASKEVGVSTSEIAKIRDFFVCNGLFTASPMHLSYTVDILRIAIHDHVTMKCKEAEEVGMDEVSMEQRYEWIHSERSKYMDRFQEKLI